MGSMNTGAKGSVRVMVAIAVFYVMTLVLPTMADPNDPANTPRVEGMSFNMLMASYEPPFDPNNQSFSVVLYDSFGWEPRVEAAMQALGIMSYTVRNHLDPVTPDDLDTHDILIIGWAYHGYSSGLSPDILANGITGRVVLSGHDADYHTVEGPEAAAQFLSQAIQFVLRDPGTGLIVLGDMLNMNTDTPFSYLPQEWDVAAQFAAGDIVKSYTAQGEASKVFEGLDPNDDMSYWGKSYHDIFTVWDSDFMSMELGGNESQDVITLARGNVYDISLSIANDVDPNICVEPGTEIIYTLSYNYPDGATPDVGNVIITDTLPRGADYVMYSSTAYYDPDTHALIWDIGTLEPGDSNSVSFTVRVNDYSVPGGKLRDFAALRSDAGTVMARNDIEVCCSDAIIFVAAAAPDGGSGRSWATAYNDLQDALARADSGCGDTIWVAQGTYKPGPGVDDSFKISPGASVYGGFSSGEDPCTFDVNDRNLRICRTVLSGEIESGTRDRIVTMSDNSLLDGFIVEKRQRYGVVGNGTDVIVRNCVVQQSVEDGIRCESGNLTCTNCIIRDNGQNGIYCYASGKTLVAYNSNISNNGYHGVYAREVTVDIRNSVIHHNGGRGSYYYGIRLIDVPDTSLIRNCTIACNANEGISNLSSVDTPVLNSILWYNQTRTPANYAQVSGMLDVKYSCITDPNNPGCVDPAQVGPRYNRYCQPDFANPDTYLIPNFHLAADSHCIDAGLGSSFPGETDIDANDRVVNGTVDMGADEVACTENIYNRADLDADGIVNFFDFAVFGNAWRGHDPNDPLVLGGQLVVEQYLLDRWSALCNFNADYVIDMKDFKVMADNWLWTACWYTQAPDPLPPFDYSSVSFYGVTYDPNEPEWDPNDFPGMMSMPSGGGEMSLAFEDAGISSPDPELTIQQLEETIDFLYTVADEVPEEADNIMEMIKSLYDEIDLINNVEPFYELLSDV